MARLLGDILFNSAKTFPDNQAVEYKGKALSYTQVVQRVDSVAFGLAALQLEKSDRVAIYLEKRFEVVDAIFAAARSGLAFVPVNPLLKAAQVEYILADCNVKILFTSFMRLRQIHAEIANCPDLECVVLVDEIGDGLDIESLPFRVIGIESLKQEVEATFHEIIDEDVAAILYTSGSTGKPKGVVLSHRNMVEGAKSVAEYLNNTCEDRLLAALPFSFDYGLSQLTTAFLVGARVSLLNFLFARDIIKALEQNQITGLAAVPPLWLQLADLEWSSEIANNLRYITNSGGAMPVATLQKLRTALPNTKPYLMYGLTEAFRSTFLDPAEIDSRPESMGKAIPNAKVMVVRPDGSECDPHEHGELVHRGALVAKGYWNDVERTAERFKPVPGGFGQIKTEEIAVWSGDTVYRDEDGFLYFVGRKDEMIKTSGYRVSPSEIEDVIYESGLVSEVIAMGISHPKLGQAIVIVVKIDNGGLEENGDAAKSLLSHCRTEMPAYMIPQHIQIETNLKRNPNGKIDRKFYAEELKCLFA
ncbi:MAG: acyl-CoA ligase (AMP-forming), exosortase A system-associated [Gammaproteobacteria bacterium]|nr:MAG: acyl-CoA ligase (AMP-forming), exosortase A system-associated [Gammaproteobacteria bacterium]